MFSNFVGLSHTLTPILNADMNVNIVREMRYLLWTVIQGDDTSSQAVSPWARAS